MLNRARLLTRPTLAVTSPARPESAKTDSSPWDAPCPKQGRSEGRRDGVPSGAHGATNKEHQVCARHRVSKAAGSRLRL
jgi:hypothetical protein